MGIFNEHSSSSKTISSSDGERGPPGPQGPQGPPGTVFKVDANGNHDLENKKLTNVNNGDADKDVMVKLQIEGYVNNKTQYLDGVQPAKVTSNKAVIYSNNGSIHSNALYLKDAPDDGHSNEIRILTPHQSYNNIQLKIPDLKNYDGNGSRPSSEIMVTSVDQTVTGKKIFRNIEVPNPTTNSQAVPKSYLDSEIAKIPSVGTSQFVLKSGSTMTGDLILQSQPYPVSGNANKAISYNTASAIFLSKKDGGSMEQTLDMNNHFITNVKDPVNAGHCVNKKYTDAKLGTKADLSKTTTQTFQGRVQVPDFNQSSHSGSDLVNLRYINNTYLNK